jgi:hypothetical protein
MPISTFPRHDYYEDEYLLKPAGLRDTHSEGKVRGWLRFGSGNSDITALPPITGEADSLIHA